jgi:hypothetical protein
MVQNLSDQVANFLSACGYSEEKISILNSESRLFHDLRAYGDNAADDLKLLETKFGVDLSTFPFQKYFPTHYGIEALFLIFWNSRLAENIKKRYPPITLRMVDEAIKKKKWEQRNAL